jgi:penicillin-binding protein 2
MRKAIATSCNVYFWAIGGGWKDVSGLGLAKIRKYWLAFGLDKKLGIDLFGEVQSVLPGIKWLKENRPNDPTWKLGDTYNVSIGEGGLLLTPLQMAAYISTIANDGILMQPHLVKQTKNIKVTQLNVSEQNLKVVQEGMREVINSGTAMTLKYLPFQVAGKSGSPKFISEGEEKYNALFGAYAPYEDPEIVVFVLIEVPSSGTVATLPIIEDVLQWYWDNRINGQQIINNEKYE